MSLRRVCVLAQLRLNHTLKKKAVGGYMIDLSKQRDGHKTSRFYGPFAASLPDALTPVLDKYCAVLEFDDIGAWHLAFLYSSMIILTGQPSLFDVKHHKIGALSITSTA